MPTPLVLRPHHSMCIAHFAGEGYSPEFTRHMQRLTALLRQQPGQPVILRCACDTLCAHCPHRMDGQPAHCDTPEKVMQLDEAYLRLLGLKEGDPLSFAQLFQRTAENMDGFYAICKDCQWYRLCCTIHEKRFGKKAGQYGDFITEETEKMDIL